MPAKSKTSGGHSEYSAPGDAMALSARIRLCIDLRFSVVITDPSDPNFDLEAYLNVVSAGETP